MDLYGKIHANTRTKKTSIFATKSEPLLANLLKQSGASHTQPSTFNDTKQGLQFRVRINCVAAAVPHYLRLTKTIIRHQRLTECTFRRRNPPSLNCIPCGASTAECIMVVISSEVLHALFCTWGETIIKAQNNMKSIFAGHAKTQVCMQRKVINEKSAVCIILGHITVRKRCISWAGQCHTIS